MKKEALIPQENNKENLHVDSDKLILLKRINPTEYEIHRGEIRTKRGLFQSSTGRLINADINGSLNIMRKVVDNSYANKIINRGLLFNPIKIRDLFNINSNFLQRKSNEIKQI